MNFEGRSAKAVGEGQIKQLLAAYTTYVSMDNNNEDTGEQMDTHLRNTVHSFSRTEGIEDLFDEQAQKGVDARCEIIQEEYTKGETPIIEPQLEVPYTKKETKRAIQKTEGEILEVHWFGWCQKLDDRQGRRHNSQLFARVL